MSYGHLASSHPAAAGDAEMKPARFNSSSLVIYGNRHTERGSLLMMEMTVLDLPPPVQHKSWGQTSALPVAVAKGGGKAEKLETSFRRKRPKIY